jgi:hypothetical protein
MSFAHNWTADGCTAQAEIIQRLLGLSDQQLQHMLRQNRAAPILTLAASTLEQRIPQLIQVSPLHQSAGLYMLGSGCSTCSHVLLPCRQVPRSMCRACWMCMCEG